MFDDGGWRGEIEEEEEEEEWRQVDDVLGSGQTGGLATVGVGVDEGGPGDGRCGFGKLRRWQIEGKRKGSNGS